MIVNISEAKAKLSQLIDMAYHGEKIIIAKNNLPLVELVAHKPEGKRPLGLALGKATIAENFNEEDEAINEMFYGKAK